MAPLVHSILQYLKQKLIGAMVMVLIFGAIGFGIALILKPNYHAEMTLSYAHLEKKIYADMIFKLNQIVGNKQYTELAQLLDIPTEEAQKIKYIDSKNIYHQPLIQDISTEKVPFYIAVDVYDNSVLKILETKIVGFLCSSDYVRERTKLNAKNFKKEADYLKKQIAYSETLKNRLLELTETDAELLTKINAINTAQYDNFKQLRDIESAMLFNENIEVLDGFVAQQPSQTKKMIKLTFLGILLGMTIRFLFPLFKN